MGGTQDGGTSEAMPTRLTQFYILFGIMVNFIWGLAFFIPYYLSNTNPAVITFGRYFVYGALSLALFMNSKTGLRTLTPSQWKTAFIFAFAGNIGYYFLLTMAIQNAGITIPAVIIGALPITIMIYGNLKNTDIGFSRLWPSIALIMAGIIGINMLKSLSLPAGATSTHSLVGALCAMAALSLWTWYGVHNSTFLKDNHNLTSSNWALAIGICSFSQSLVAFPIVLFSGTLNTVFLGTLGDPLFHVVLGCIILGVVVSWLATVWWNNVSRHLPTSLVGQLIVFETISSIIYEHIADGVIPRMFEVVSVMMIVAGVLLGIRSFNKTPSSDSIS